MLPSILKLEEVKKLTRISRSGIYLKISKGVFPAPISLGGRAIGWLEPELEAWINDRIEQRDEKSIKLNIKAPKVSE